MKVIRFHSIFIFSIFFLLCTESAFSQTDLRTRRPDNKKAEAFKKIEVAMAHAIAAKAPELAPALYSEAIKAYKKTRAEFEKSKFDKKLQQQIDEVSSLFGRATKTAATTQNNFSDLIAGRREAARPEYIKLSPKKFGEGERLYQETVAMAEQATPVGGKLAAAREKAAKAMRLYREMTVEALLKGPLQDAEKKLETAKAKLPRQTYDQAMRGLKALAKTVEAAEQQEFNIAKFTATVLNDNAKILAVLQPDESNPPKKSWAEWSKEGEQALAALNYRSALEAFQNALALQPNETKTQFLIAALHLQLSEPEPALKAFAAVLERDPKNVAAHNALGYLYEAKFKDDKIAAQHYERALKLDPSNAYTLAHLGAAYLRLDRLAEAESVLQKALASDQNSSTAERRSVQDALGLVYLKKGLIDEARQLWGGREFELPRYGSGSLDKHFILTQTFWTPIQKISDIPLLKDQYLREAIDYYNDLGKVSQAILIKESPDKKDLVEPVEYDQFGSKSKAYLQYAAAQGDGEYKPNAAADQLAFYQNAPHVPHSAYPFAETVYEKSPLLRVREKGKAGESWQPGGRTPASGHTVRIKERGNDPAEVRLWQWDETQNLFVSTGFYQAGELQVRDEIDENGNTALNFIDKFGRNILQRTFNENEFNQLFQYDIYHLYDRFGNLRFIVPPMAVREMSASNRWQIDQTIKDKWATEYVYDGDHRRVEKRIAGAAPQFTIYDRRGRAVLVQDGNLRQTNDWVFTKYDIFSREILTGIYHDETRTTRPAMQSYAESFVDGVNTFFYEARDTADFANRHGYTNRAFPPHEPARLLTVTYFNDYDFDFDGVADVALANDPELAPTHSNWRPFARLENKVTKEKVRVLTTRVTGPSNQIGTALEPPGSNPPPVWLETTNFYDQEGRIIQLVATNIVAGTDTINTAYDFSSRVVKSKILHASAYDTVAVRKRFAYDHAGRLARAYQRNNDDNEMLVVAENYNALGNLIEMNLHSENDGGTFLQSVDYVYHIRGWLERINNPVFVGGQFTSGNNNASDFDGVNFGPDLFGISYLYERQDNRFANTPRFNYTISAAEWAASASLSAGPFNAFDMKYQSYKYQYDRVNQLREAHYRLRDLYDNPLPGNDEFTMFAKYDGNNNIKSLSQRGVTAFDENGAPSTYGLIDNLTYVYQGNQLVGVDDAVAAAHANDFSDNGSQYRATNPEYLYDVNGNMTLDRNKSMAVQYNHLNLPTKAEFGNTLNSQRKIQWTYSAAGAKLMKRVHSPDQPPKTIFYSNGFVYEFSGQSGGLDFFTMAEGRVKKLSDGALRYEYDLKDHLDNVRVSFTKGANATTPEILQDDHYYPFGMKMAGLNRLASNHKANKFIFNGKELEDEHGLNWYHYGARYYDPQLGRWHAMDPAEEFLSPYLYAANNPVMLIDPDGAQVQLGEISQVGTAEAAAYLAPDGKSLVGPNYLPPMTVQEMLIQAVLGTVAIGGATAVAAFGTKAVVVFVATEAAEEVVEAVTGIPVIVDPVDIGETLVKKQIKKNLFEGRNIVEKVRHENLGEAPVSKEFTEKFVDTKAEPGNLTDKIRPQPHLRDPIDPDVPPLVAPDIPNVTDAVKKSEKNIVPDVIKDPKKKE